jgi:hypothetical protein
MGLSRRQFTKEFKRDAVRRLEQGISVGEAARALEVTCAGPCTTDQCRAFVWACHGFHHWSVDRTLRKGGNARPLLNAGFVSIVY